MDARSITSWRELITNTRICAICSTLVWIDEASDHINSHISGESCKRTISIELDESLVVCEPEVLYVCGSCNSIPPETLQGDPVNAIGHHLERSCRARVSKDSPKIFRIIRDKESIKELIRSYEGEKKLELFFCPQGDDAFKSLDELAKHVEARHIQNCNKSDFMKQFELQKLSEEMSRTVEQLSKELPAVQIRQPEHPHLQVTVKRVRVPHPRSILKKLAGIDEHEENEEPPEEDVEDKDELEASLSDFLRHRHPRGDASAVKKEVRFTNILYGHINLTKDLAQMLDVQSKTVVLVADDGSRLECSIDPSQKLLRSGQPLCNWFNKYEILPGCYVYITKVAGREELELGFANIETQMRKCLIATWNDEEHRVALSHEDITVRVECSEHLFRSSVNLDDQRVLNFMARLYGSIFDVLYLGMRDLLRSGYETVHYRNLHNMVIDKRLHPQLGSVFVELSKNACFHRQGGGYWSLAPDPRIEAILPNALHANVEPATEPLSIQDDAPVSPDLPIEKPHSKDVAVIQETQLDQHLMEIQQSDIEHIEAVPSVEAATLPTTTGSGIFTVLVRFVRRLIAALRGLFT
jgi:hypothetical protein